MPSTYSTSLKIELIGNGEQSGIWGQTTNNNLGTLIEQAITGVGQIALDNVSTYTLTSLNGLEDQARNNVLVFSGDPQTNCLVTAPSAEKVYIVSNEVSNNYTVTIKTATGNGITILNGAKQLIYCDGADFYTGISVNSIFGDLTVSNNAFVSGNVSVSGKITVNNNVTSSFSNITMTANSSIISMLPNKGGFIVPTGTTAQRPSSPIAGMARWNTDVGAYEIWNGVNWENISAGTYDGSYLIIAGGGGGGIGVGSGGGAGGLLTGTYALVPSTSYTITVGAGGAGGVKGSNSSALSLVSIGGGAGGNASFSSSGGSGGGSGGAGAGSGTSGQGYAGGPSAGGSSGQTYGGGGGGAGQAGQSAVANARGGDGGNGVQSDITGTNTYYAGGAAGYWQGIGGTGGSGGAGSGNYGGGGDGYDPSAGKNGVVIIRYAYPTQRGTGGNVTSYTSGSTKYWVHTFTTSGTFIA